MRKGVNVRERRGGGGVLMCMCERGGAEREGVCVCERVCARVCVCVSWCV